jgi:hypothetical protein
MKAVLLQNIKKSLPSDAVLYTRKAEFLNSTTVKTSDLTLCTVIKIQHSKDYVRDWFCLCVQVNIDEHQMVQHLGSLKWWWCGNSSESIKWKNRTLTCVDRGFRILPNGARVSVSIGTMKKNSLFPVFVFYQPYQRFIKITCILYILESNPHSVFGDFLNEKKLVRGSNPHLSFNCPLPTGQLIE